MDSISQRAELHKTIWKIAEELRGSVDGWDFKSYVLGFLFYRFISEHLKLYINSQTNEDYALLDDEKALSAKNRILNAKGFFIKPSDLFENILKIAQKSNSSMNFQNGAQNSIQNSTQKLAHESTQQDTQNSLQNLNELLQNAFKNIQDSCLGSPSEENFKDLFKDIDANSPKLGNSTIDRNKKLLKIMQAIASLNLEYEDSKVDALGDVYEFLMTMYASNAGKSGGEFFTPQEVSNLLVKLTLINNSNPNKVYDPACGSGSLLLQYKKCLHKDPKLGYYGQEINITTFNLCRMNMFLHNVGFEKFHIALGDTLISPNQRHKDTEPFDAIVSNPPYSISWAGKDDITLINDDRFSKAGVLAPKSKADLAFVMHMLSWLSEKGSAAIVCFPGIMYRGGAEENIRSYLVDNNFCDAVISLSDNLFFGTSISVCILILRKNKIDNNVFFIDASNEFQKDVNKNILSNVNITNILNIYEKRQEIPHIAKLVSKDKIKENNYNLSVSSYVEAKDLREKINIKELNNQISQIVQKQNSLRMQIDSIIEELESA